MEVTGEEKKLDALAHHKMMYCQCGRIIRKKADTVLG